MIVTLDSQEYGDNNGVIESQNDGTSFERSSSLAPWGVVLNFTTNESIYGSTIYYNPFIHANVGISEFGLPSRGFKYVIPASGSASAFMIPHNLGGFAAQRETTEVQIEWIDANTFTIRHNYYQFYDHGGMYPDLSQDAYDVLFKNHKSASIQFYNSFSSVYNTLKAYFAHVYVKALSPATNGETSVTFGVINKYFNMLKPGWTSLQFLSRTSGPVTDLSAFEKTKVTFQITRPGGIDDVVGAFIYLFRGDPGFPTNAQPIWTDVAAEIMPIADDPYIGSISGGKIYGPLSQPALTGDTWETSFYIGGVIPGERYHAACLWYIRPADGPPSTWYSVTQINTSETPYIVEGEPEPLGVTITGEFDDLKKTISANKPIFAPVQRHKVRAIFTKATYDGNAVTAGAPFTDTDTDLTQIELKVFGGTIYSAFRSGGTWITTDPRFTIIDNATYVIAEFDFRTQYGGAFTSWIGVASIWFQFKFHFEYAALPTYVVEYNYEERCAVKDFEDRIPQNRLISAINLYSAVTGMPVTNLCGDEDILVEVLLNMALPIADATKYWFQGYVDKTPYGVSVVTDGALNEEESFVPLSVVQKTSGMIYDVDAQFSATGKAYFKVNVASLAVGTEYKVYAGATLLP